MVLNNFEAKDGRLGAWIAAGILTGGAAIATSWCLNSRIPLLKLVTGAGGAILGGMAITALVDCDDAARYKRVERETDYQKFLGASQASLRNVLNYLLAAAPPPTSPTGQFPAANFAALPPVGEEEIPELDIRILLNYPTVRVTGPQGAGKSRIVEEVTHKRCEAGYEAIIIDPHCEYGQWEGLKVIGKGQDYGAIERWITWFIGEIKDRYHRRATEPNYNPPPMTIVCEELTGWKKNGVKNAGELELAGYSDTRKINIAITLVAHGKTSELMGGGKGLAKTREAGAADLELFAEIDRHSGKATPKLEGTLKLPSQDPQPVRIPHLAPLPPGAFRRYGEKAAIAPSTPITDSDNVQNRLTLEKTLTAEPTADAIPPDEWEIIKMGMHGKELTTREILRSAPGRRLKLNAESCSAMFERWAEFGLGRLKTEKLPNGTTQSKFIFEQR
jgi:hypothetical protein